MTFEFFSGEPRQQRDRVGMVFGAFTLAFGLMQIYACRYELDPDGMDYLDISRQVAEGHWKAIANGYWGTFDAVMRAPLFLFHPLPTTELPLAHLFGLFVLLATFITFRFFLHSCLDTVKNSSVDGMCPLPDRSLCVLGYALYMWSSLVLVPAKIIGPDPLVTVFVYLSAGVLVQLTDEAPLGRYLLFGVALGLGYWTKAIMFPVGLIFLATSIIKAPNWKKNAYSLLAFAAMAAPLLVALSNSHGRFTFGDSGKLNYSSLVSPGGRVINWQGFPVGSGIPKHPARTIAGFPTIYEFNGPVRGTYPPSYDPSYWNEGRRAAFNLSSQVTVVAHHIPRAIETFFVAELSLTAGFLFLFFVGSFRVSVSQLWNRWDLLLVSLATLSLYILVNFETRFIGAFVVLLWIAALAALRIPGHRESQRIAQKAVVALVIAMLLSFASNIAKTIANNCPESALSHIELAQKLNLTPGTPIAVIGQGNFAYWAHLGQLRIVAEIMASDEAAFWSLPEAKRQERCAAFRNTGAQWIIAQPPSVLVDTLETSWKRIGMTSY